MMKKNSKLVLVLILVGMIFSVAAGSLSIYSTTRRITENVDADYSPETDGKSIVWTGYTGGDAEIYYHDIDTNRTRQITNNSASDTSPQVDGDFIVWKSAEDGDNEIYLYQISTLTTTKISNNSFDDRYAQISGDFVVWQGIENDNADIYLYQISSGTITQVSDHPDTDGSPQIDGDYITWKRFNSYDRNIYMYQISNNTITQITDDGLLKENPQISGDSIVWEGDARADIFHYSISTGITTRITDDSDENESPSVQGDYVAWIGNGSGNYEVYFYQISTEAITQITDNLARDYPPSIDGDYIVWYSLSSGIMLYEISTDTVQPINGGGLLFYPKIVSNIIVWDTGGFDKSEIYFSTISRNPSNGTYDSDSTYISKTGVWDSIYTWPGPIGGWFIATNETDASAAFTFYGHQIALLFNRDTNYGEAEIIIDNGTPITLDQFDSSLSYQNRWDSPELENGDHTISFQHPGGGHDINVDAFVVFDPDHSPPSPVELTASTGFSSGTVNLAWKAPGDDDTRGGAATTYFVRYATSPIDSEAEVA